MPEVTPMVSSAQDLVVERTIKGVHYFWFLKKYHEPKLKYRNRFTGRLGV